jgi:hypothetical protein
MRVEIQIKSRSKRESLWTVQNPVGYRAFAGTLLNLFAGS